MEMFKAIMEKFDAAQDKYIAPYVGMEFGKIMGSMGLLLIVILGVAGLFLAMGWHGSKIVQPVYFFAPKDGEVKRALVITSPSLSHAKIQKWSGNALREMYTFTFRDVDERVTASKKYFDGPTGAAFIASSESLITEVKDKQLFSSLTLLEEPAIVQQMTVGGNMVWLIEVPAMLTIIGGEEPKYTNYMFQLTIKQVPITENPEGIVIIKKTYKGT